MGKDVERDGERWDGSEGRKGKEANGETKCVRERERQRYGEGERERKDREGKMWRKSPALPLKRLLVCRQPRKGLLGRESLCGDPA